MITTGSIYPLHEYLLLTILNRGRQLLPDDQQEKGDRSANSPELKFSLVNAVNESVILPFRICE